MLGMEHAPPIFTRGILVDIASAIAPRRLDVGDTISVSDIQAALKRQGMSDADIQPGDALFVNTGWGDYWKKNNAKFNGSNRCRMTMRAGPRSCNVTGVSMAMPSWVND